MKRPLCFVSLVFVIIIAILVNWLEPPSFSFNEKEGSSVTLQGKVIKKQRKESKLTVYLSNVTFCDEKSQKEKKKELRAICYLSDESGISYEPKMGSVVEIRGKAKEFSEPTNPGEFHQKKYQQIEGFDFYCTNAIILKESTAYQKRKEALYQFRQRLSLLLEHYFSEQNAGILKAMLLGEKQEINEESKELYQRNGIAHILAISGLHIAILGMGLYQLLLRMRIPIPLAVLLSVLLLYSYGEMTGMSSSCYRAIFMFIIHLLAKLYRRAYDILTALALAAVLFLCRHPFFVKQTAFLLSYGAIIGIALLFPALQEVFCDKQKKKTKKITEAALVNISVTYLTFPILLLSYYEIATYSFLFNLLLIPLLSIILYSGIFTLLAGSLWIWAGRTFSIPASSLLWIYEKACLLALYLPYPTCTIGRPATWKIILFYIGILVIILFPSKLKKRGTILILVSIVVLLSVRLPKGVKITMLDVGQGDSIFMRSPKGTTFLIDGGSSSKNEVGKYQITPFLKYFGVSKLDYVFLTHMDNDHISGVLELLQNTAKQRKSIPIKRIITTQSSKNTEEWNRIVELSKACGTELFYMKQGDMLQEEGLQITCLSPSLEAKSLEDNESSLVLQLSYRDFDMLLTGDLEGEGERLLIDELHRQNKNGRQIDYEVLKVAHHGSKNATSNELLDLLNTQLALISSGKNNPYGHPHTETLTCLQSHNIQTFQTSLSGAITIWTNGEKMKIEKFCKEK